MNEVRIQTVRFGEEPGIRAVREQVFVREQGVPLALEWDGEDSQAIHVVAALPDGRVVGTGRLLADGHLGRLAVLPDWRRRGVGTALLRGLMQEASRLGLTRVFLHAQTRAAGFYTRHGFVRRGEEFLDAGIPHCYMERNSGD